MKVFISQPMKGYSNLEIEVIRSRITNDLKEKYGNDVEVIDSFVKSAPANAKPLWYLGESIKKLSKADIAVFAYKEPTVGNYPTLARGCKIEERCAIAYDTLCLYVAFDRGSFQQAVDIEIDELSTKRPDFSE